MTLLLIVVAHDQLEEIFGGRMGELAHASIATPLLIGAWCTRAARRLEAYPKTLGYLEPSGGHANRVGPSVELHRSVAESHGILPALRRDSGTTRPTCALNPILVFDGVALSTPV
jgi:hypothetical protein